MNNTHDTRDRTLFCLMLLALGLVALLSLARLACGGDDLLDARNRLRQIEAEKRQSAEVSAAKAAQERQEFSAQITPQADPISTRKVPEIRFESANSGTSEERLPRAVLVVGQYCSPCLRIERECADLIGGKDSPIELVQNWLANDLETWGVTPGMQISTPAIFILNKEGKVHALSAGGLGCVLRGYHSREAILDYIALPEHDVSIDRKKPPPVLATVQHADATPETFAAVLAAHLAASSGQQVSDEQYLYGGLFDFSVDVPESWRRSCTRILTAQQLEFASAGITFDWSGPQRSFSVTKEAVTITPPVRVRFQKWLISYSASLDGVTFSADLSTVTVLLTGAPDLTIRLQ